MGNNTLLRSTKKNKHTVPVRRGLHNFSRAYPYYPRAARDFLDPLIDTTSTEHTKRRRFVKHTLIHTNTKCIRSNLNTSRLNSIRHYNIFIIYYVWLRVLLQLAARAIVLFLFVISSFSRGVVVGRLIFRGVY